MSGGHLGIAKTASGIQLRAYWPTWKSDLEEFLRACEPCARYYRGKVRRQTPLRTPWIGEPWQRVSVDITGHHPRSSNSKQYILSLLDHFSTVMYGDLVAKQNPITPGVSPIFIIKEVVQYRTLYQYILANNCCRYSLLSYSGQWVTQSPLLTLRGE